MKLTRKAMIILLTVMLLFPAGCQKQNPIVKIKTLTIAMAPTSDPETLSAAGQPLGKLIQEKLLAHGYEVGEVIVLVGSSNDAVLEGLGNGNVDIAIVPSSTYGLSYSTKYRPILVGLSNQKMPDDVTIKDIYAEELPSYEDGNYAKYRRSCLYVNVNTETGRKLLEKAEQGSLTLGDLNAVRWSVGAPSDEIGYIYPSAWLTRMFGSSAKLSALQNANSYGSDYDNITALLKGETDIITGSADLRDQTTSQTAFRIQYPNLATKGETVYDAVRIIGMSAPVINQLIMASSNKKMTNELIGCLQELFVEVMKSGEGEKCLSILGLKGFAPCTEDELGTVKEVYGK
ncbi:MAG: PhnD/SsuA/transferrin family substrate-binding protein [Erysipelotrichaceae bacterium]|nr:PhnD/SsuA/transferrin family substrate-binding protein [Erysipelotrichaceae bacterium]